MIQKVEEREQAIKLRKQGFSYSEILQKIPIARSTLSLWLRNAKLAKKQRQRITEKRLKAARRGGEIKHKKRIDTIEKIKTQSQKEIGKISKRDLWLLGIAIYWGEGHKERSHGSPAQLVNSDPRMIKVFLKWGQEILRIPREDIKFRIFLHRNSVNRLVDVQKYWSQVTGFPIDQFQKVSWKKNKISANYRHIRQNYYGILRVTIKRSTNLNRKIQGWIEGIYENCRVV